MVESWRSELTTYLDRNLAGDYLPDEPLASHTWYQIGGPADFFVYPKHIEDLKNLLHQCSLLEVDTYFIGEGANMLVSDDGYRGVMINLKRYFTDITKEGHVIHVSAGVLLQDAIEFCEHQGLGGLQYLSGIPGTIGGALTMNAGTNRGEIGDAIIDVSILNEQLTPVTIAAKHISFNYRSVPQLHKKPILGCRLNLVPTDEAVLRQLRVEQLAQRTAKQPLDCPSCGSVFKRPHGYYVGKLVEELGLKGLRHGNAMISEKHGGFIVNLGDAKASDVMYLIEKIKDEVYQHVHVELETEVKLIGFQ